MLTCLTLPMSPVSEPGPVLVSDSGHEENLFNGIAQYRTGVKEDFFFFPVALFPHYNAIYVMPKKSCPPSQSKFPIVCVCQIVLQRLVRLAGVNTVVPLYPEVFRLSASETHQRFFSKISQSCILTKKRVLILLCLLVERHVEYIFEEQVVERLINVCSVLNHFVPFEESFNTWTCGHAVNGLDESLYT